MALNTSLIDMPAWMKPPDTPESTSFLRAFENAQEMNSPRYKAQVQHLQSIAAQSAFDIQKGQLDVEKQKFIMEDMLAGQSQEKEMAQAMSQVQDWSDPRSVATLDAIYAKRPTAAGQKMLTEARIRQKEAAAAQDRSEKIALDFEARTATTALGYEKAKSAAELAQAKLEAAQGKMTPQQQERDDFAKLSKQKSDLETLIKANPGYPGLHSMLADVNSRLNAWEVQHNATQETIESTPGGGLRITRGGGKAAQSPDQLTTANVTKAQDSINQSVMTIEAADRLAPLISSETVGPRAFVESWVNDRFLANFFPNMANEKRVSAERFAAELRSTTIRELRSDGNISEAERRQILDAVPQMNNPIDSPARAQELVSASKKTAAIRALITARRLGVAYPQPAIRALEDTDLIRIAKIGLISKAEAQNIWKLKRAQ